MLYRINLWASLMPEAFAPMLAQGETVVEKAVSGITKTGADFGNANDSVRFGMVIVFLVTVCVVVTYLIFRLFLSLQTSTIKELKDRVAAQDAEMRECRREHERRYDELRNKYEKLTDGYFGTLQYAVSEVAAMNKVMAAMGFHVQRPAVTLPPPAPVIEPPPSGRGAQFLPGRPRRIQPRQKDETSGDEN